MVHVLVVDDRPDVRQSIVYMLEAGGYAAGEASDGSGALVYLGKNRVDVVLTDLAMPGMNGYDLADIIRKSPQPHPHVIAMTGSALEGISDPVLAARAAGADVVLEKPVSRETLLNAIRTLGHDRRVRPR